MWEKIKSFLFVLMGVIAAIWSLYTCYVLYEDVNDWVDVKFGGGIMIYKIIFFVIKNIPSMIVCKILINRLETR
ncbi:hypothetical protein N9W34_03185 [Rickettsiales bacterium]|nr:hypothetical protein [Rickettsiales bacterium]